jgi:GNAT superfamily N-acetyltransferase
MEIRQAIESDKPGVWAIIRAVIATGDSYAFDPQATEKEMMEYWFGPGKFTYVAIENNEIHGSYVMRPNQPGLGNHVANAGYMVAPNHQGKGLGKKMGEHSLQEAKKLGFKAMQFNFVVKSNQVAVRLWLSLGFQIAGEIPNAFRHSKLGLTNVYILYKDLSVS